MQLWDCKVGETRGRTVDTETERKEITMAAEKERSSSNRKNVLF